MARAATRFLLMRSRERSKISPSEASPISMSSAAASDDPLSALGPASQPVSTGYPSGYWVHQVGTVASESRNDRSDRYRPPRSRPPRLAHHFVVKRNRNLTTLPNPISTA